MAKKITEQSEIKRLQQIYAELPPKMLALAQGLIVQAARIRVKLDVLNADLQENGLTELFQQSDKVEPYTRERPEAALFVKLDKNYQAIIRQLQDMVPAEAPESDALDAFLKGEGADG